MLPGSLISVELPFMLMMMLAFLAVSLELWEQLRKPYIIYQIQEIETVRVILTLK